MSPPYFQFGLLVPQTTPADMQAFFYALPVKEPNLDIHFLLTRENILLFLANNQIVFGILETAIEQILEKAEARHQLIAFGVYPLKGSSAYYQNLVSSRQEYYESLFKENSRLEQEDWNNCLTQSLVLPGAALVKKHLPCRGAPGRNIKGEMIAGDLGSDLPAPYLINAGVSDLEANVWIAKMKGIPRFELPTRIGVEPISLLERDLDSSEYFKGSVWVKGNVLDYVRLRAQGDIFVSGTVDAAVLIAERRIWIGQGVKGKESATLKANFDIRIGFAENSSIEAGLDLYANTLHHCYAVAFKKAEIKQIVGGETFASILLRVGIVGTLGVESVLTCGQNDYICSKIKILEQEIEDYVSLIESIKLKLCDTNFLLNPQNAIKEHFQLRIAFGKHQIKALNKDLLYLKQIESEIPQAEIFIEKALYAGTLIRLRDFEHLKEEYMPGPLQFIAGRYGVINHYEKALQE